MPIRNLFILLLSVVMLASCSVERRLAGEFVNRRKTVSVLLLKPDFIYKTNYKVKAIKGFDKLTDTQKDSLWLANTLFLDSINQQKFIKNWADMVVNELKEYGVRVYMADNIDSFLQPDSSAYIFRVAQMELEEYVIPQREEEVFDTLQYYKDFWLNAVNLNTWFEVARLNDSNGKMNILFSSHLVRDVVKGRFAKHWLWGDISYRYNEVDINTEDVFYLSAFAAKKQAGYIFDYLMNEYIKQHISWYDEGKKIYSFDRVEGKIRPAGDDCFIELE